MKTANENGVYEPDTCDELARHGHSYAAVKICQCDDGLFRYALDLTYSYGGFGNPISHQSEGFPTRRAAKDAATEELLRRFPAPWASEPRSVHEELAVMKAQIEYTLNQPSLF